MKHPSMLKRRILLLLAALAALFVVLALVLRPKPEPEYEGKKLSEWVTQLGNQASPTEARAARTAIRQMGTNTLPYLREWVGYEPPTWKRQVSRAARTLGNRRLWWIYQTESVRRVGATFAFQAVFRGEGAGEIENLSRIANDPKRSESRRCAIFALDSMGVAALPALVGVLTNEQSRTAKSSVIRIMCAHYIARDAFDEPATARLAEPALLSMREDPDPEIRLRATNTLRVLDPKRRS